MSLRHRQPPQRPLGTPAIEPKPAQGNVLVHFVSHLLLLGIFFVISILHNIRYVYHRMVLRFLLVAYYPNKLPQVIRNDVTKLGKIPKRVSIILDLKDDNDENGGVDGLINDISELAAWAVSAGIPHLTIYEYNGIVKGHVDELLRYISKNLTSYFGTDLLPSYLVRIPHSNKEVRSNDARPVDLHITLLSRIDGKPTIIELTQTMSELASQNELSIKDINVDLIDEELQELVGPEPDLLVSFAPVLDLQDYPPWHIRLSEIYWEPDNMGVNYAVFIRALQRFSNCKVNLGK